LTIIANTLLKYLLHSIDLYSENPWENKAVFMLYTELIIGLVKVILYGLFIVIMVRIYTLPLFAVRPMYLTARAFKKAFNDVILSRRAIHNMNTWYPDATPEELENTDNWKTPTTSASFAGRKWWPILPKSCPATIFFTKTAYNHGFKGSKPVPLAV